MRTKLKANVIISNDTDGKNVLFGYDDTLSQETIDTYTGCVSGKFSVASSTTYTLPFGDLSSVKGIYVKGDAAYDFSVNGGAAITSNIASSSGSSKVLLQADLSSFSVTNNGSAALTGIWVAWGEL